MQTHNGLDAALRSIADELTVVRDWHQVSRSLEQGRFATVFGSARTERGAPSYEMARELGEALAERGWAVVTGGGPGIMQAARDGSGDTRSRSVRIEIPGEEPETVLDRTRAITVATFALRKLLLIHDIDALFVFPGGVGTFDELFEVLVQQDTGRLRRIPVVLVEPEGGRLWDAWLRFMDEHLMQSGLASPSVLANLRSAKSVDAALAAVAEPAGRALAEMDGRA
ncbi:hypothetical protein EDD29_4302 [Actinocorallia herbida]|uniref:Cytokinin riboside 5'-monophosphate phosphoribohydrolase n=1 Tax=Actinocorallia herbida TaxID=58109 RepID=A0A3N1CZL3_9ACTN|nr:TIGR00730 family Rossman fold protein [Actinocorallia herbida]ROO86724.1 hypothetical protein EDD29_4302 [Actinocorallia herbida]